MSQQKLLKGDMVVYNHDEVWRPAMVEKIYPQEDAEPKVSLIVFMTGYHQTSFGVQVAAEQGLKKGQWTYREEDPSTPENIAKAKKAEEAKAKALEKLEKAKA